LKSLKSASAPLDGGFAYLAWLISVLKNNSLLATAKRSEDEQPKEKGPVFWTRPFFRFNLVDVLFGNYVDGTWAFFALANIVRYRLAFLKVSVSAHLNLRMMDEQFFAAFIGDNKSKTFFAVKPLYFTCSHCNSFGPCGPLTKILSLIVN
jgi:hypothetical protein